MTSRSKILDNRRNQREAELLINIINELVKIKSTKSDIQVNQSSVPLGKNRIKYLMFNKDADTNDPNTFPVLIEDDDFEVMEVLNAGKFEGFYEPPGGTGDFRGMFADLNRILIKQQNFWHKQNTPTLNVTTNVNCNNNASRKERKNSQAWYNMCFYCGKIKGNVNLQCDHVIPIIQMFVSVIPNKNIFYNFESVHAECNGTAKKMNLSEIWDSIGTSKFPGPSHLPYSNFLVKDSGNIKNINVTSDLRAYCRGYLAYQILNKLSFYTLDEQMIRVSQLSEVVNRYLKFKTSVENLYLTEVGTAAAYLKMLNKPQSIREGKIAKFRIAKFGTKSTLKLLNIKESTNKSKKWQATFDKNGQTITEHFGASGMSDYTIHKDKDRRNRYIARHLVDLRTKDPTRAGYLSMFILWNKPSFEASVKDYKERLNQYNKTETFPEEIDGYGNSFGVREVRQLARTKTVEFPTDVLRKIDRMIQTEKIQRATQKYLPKKRMSNYLAEEFYNPDPGEELYKFDPKDSRTTNYLEQLAKFRTKRAITENLEHWDNLRKIFIEFRMSQNEKLSNMEQIRNKFTSKIYFIKIINKLTDLNVNTTNFNKKINSKEMSNFFDNTNPATNRFGIPDNVNNKQLYEVIKANIKSKIKDRRWGAYDSGRLVKTYKAAGGTYSKSNDSTKLNRWFDEKWIDACRWPHNVPCGRDDMTSTLRYCRPSAIVNASTPTTVQELTKSELKRRCREKSMNPSRIIK